MSKEEWETTQELIHEAMCSVESENAHKEDPEDPGKCVSSLSDAWNKTEELVTEALESVKCEEENKQSNEGGGGGLLGSFKSLTGISLWGSDTSTKESSESTKTKGEEDDTINGQP